MSLQTFLRAHIPETISAKKIKKALDAGKCRLNGKPERFGTRLVGLGDKIEIESTETSSKTVVGEDQVLYVDDDLIAFNKAPGELSDSKVILEFLKQRYGKAILLHRLDKETSGILLFARSDGAAKAVEDLFKIRKVEKTYFAIVDGVPTKKSGVIENELGKLKVYEGQTLWGEVATGTGLPAKTLWEVKSAGKTAALVICRPQTGRTHQLRVHLSGIGHPILGDHQYGKRFKTPYNAPRILLHAAEISFDHPRSGKNVTITAPLPPDFIEGMEWIKYSS